jgi:hypothetical protein
VTFGTWFLIVWIVLAVVALTNFAVRRRRGAPSRKIVHGQPVTFATRAAVQIHARGMEGNGWVSLKRAGQWPEFLVHSGGLEVTIGAFDVLALGNTMLLEGATMRRERLGPFPLVVGNHDCIRLRGTDGTDPREWKVSPRGTPIDEVWAHLVAAGVTPTA